MSKEKKQNKSSRLSFIQRHSAIYVSLIGFTIPVVVYFMGFSYHSGWLNEFGVNNEFFPRNLEYYFIQGFYVFTGAIFSFFKHLKYLFYFTLYIGFVYIIINLTRIDTVKNFLTKNQRKILNKDRYTAIDLIINTFVFTVCIGYVFFFTFFTVTSFYLVFGKASSNHGAFIAKELKENYQGCTLYNSNIHDCAFVYDVNNQLLDQGVVIAKSETQLLLWNGQNATLHIMNNQTITFQHSKKPDKKYYQKH